MCGFLVDKVCCKAMIWLGELSRYWIQGILLGFDGGGLIVFEECLVLFVSGGYCTRFDVSVDRLE